MFGGLNSSEGSLRLNKLNQKLYGSLFFYICRPLHCLLCAV